MKAFVEKNKHNMCLAKASAQNSCAHKKNECRKKNLYCRLYIFHNFFFLFAVSHELSFRIFFLKIGCKCDGDTLDTGASSFALDLEKSYIQFSVDMEI